MADLHKFKVFLPINHREAYVEMDGKRLEGVTGIGFSVTQRKGGEIRLTVLGEIEVNGEFTDGEILTIKRGKETATDG